MTGMHSRLTSACNPEHLPKSCFGAKAPLLPPIMPNRNQPSRPPKKRLFKPQLLLFQPLPPLTNPFRPPLQPTRPKDRHVPPPPRFRLQALRSDSHRDRGTAATLTTTVIMASTPQGAPWYQLPWRGLYCRLGGATVCRLRAFLWAHPTNQCPLCTYPEMFYSGPILCLDIFDRL
jgi:hypothetical protein